jgi:hypothetical protein
MPDSPPAADLSFSLVRDDAWYRLQRALRLVPADGKDGVFRRILFFIVLAWLPLVAVATMEIPLAELLGKLFKTLL